MLFPITVLLWLGAGSWFFARYHYQQQMMDTKRPYRAAVGPIKEPLHQSYIIFLSGQRSGRDELSIIPIPSGGYRIENRLKYQISLGVLKTDCETDFDLLITPAYDLDSFKVSVRSGATDFSFDGRIVRKQGEGALIEIAFMLGTKLLDKMTMPAPEGFNVADSFMMVMHPGPPKPGTKWSSQTIDPVSRQFQEVLFSVLDRDELPGTQGRVFAYPIKAEVGTQILMTYVDDTGAVLWEEAPYAITLVREDIVNMPHFAFPGSSR